jgi:hypothetical protein
MIQDLDKTIEELVGQNIASDLAPPSLTISFNRPDETFKSYPAVNFFLYEVVENLGLRSSRMRVSSGDPQDGTGFYKNYPPARVNFSYLVTAWSKSDDPVDEHYILGETMKTLLIYRTIPEDVLQGTLEGLQPLPVTSALQAGNIKSPGEFWQAMGGKPRPALNYTVTMDVDVFETKEIPLVQDLDIVADPVKDALTF